jgi:hypothetical protein
MIISIASGQFGNQLFQYLFCKKLESERGKNDKIVLIGFQDIKKCFESDCFQNITFIKRENRFQRIILNRILRNIIFKIFSQLKIISTCSIRKEILLEQYERETTEYFITNGLFKNIIYLPTFYAQSDVFFNKEDAEKLIIKSKYWDKASEITTLDQGKIKVFVHLRLGDYHNFTIMGKPTILPISYFEQCCKELEIKYKDQIVFYILSNEKNLEKFEFINQLSNYKVFSNSFFVDFAIMTQCNGAVISASSFSWWGSYFMQNKIEIFAPKHWLGFASSIDFQTQPTRNDMTLVQIH